MHLKLSGVVNHEENERGWDSLESLNNDHFLAYVGGPRFINPTFYSLANFISQLASMYREVVAIVSFQKNGPHTVRFFYTSTAVELE